MTTNTHVCKQKRKKQSAYRRKVSENNIKIFSNMAVGHTFTLHFMEYKTLTARDEQEYTPQSLVFSAEKCCAGT